MLVIIGKRLVHRRANAVGARRGEDLGVAHAAGDALKIAHKVAENISRVAVVKRRLCGLRTAHRHPGLLGRYGKLKIARERNLNAAAGKVAAGFFKRGGRLAYRHVSYAHSAERHAGVDLIRMPGEVSAAEGGRCEQNADYSYYQDGLFSAARTFRLFLGFGLFRLFCGFVLASCHAVPPFISSAYPYTPR